LRTFLACFMRLMASRTCDITCAPRPHRSGTGHEVLKGSSAKPPARKKGNLVVEDLTRILRRNHLHESPQELRTVSAFSGSNHKEVSISTCKPMTHIKYLIGSHDRAALLLCLILAQVEKKCDRRWRQHRFSVLHSCGRELSGMVIRDGHVIDRSTELLCAPVHSSEVWDN
jgi:hypothetical protein